MWRPEDQALLERLEDELVVERLFRYHVGVLGDRTRPHPRAAGMIASVRALPGGEDAVNAALAGNVTLLARFVEAAPMSARPAPMLHHVALYFGKVARTLESVAADAAANAWMRALAAWLALGEEHDYLARLEEGIVGAEAKGPKPRTNDRDAARAVLIPPDRVPLEMLADLGKRAETSSRDLAPPGRAALLALAWVGEAGRIAGTSSDVTKRAQQAAERRRNGALDAALAVIGEALDEANVRGELTTNGRAILTRAIHVWVWSGEDEAVEQFVIDRLGTIGWELYRARAWDALRTTFEPFRPMIERFAWRIEQDPLSKIAFAAPCAQMFVFLTDIEPVFARKMELAERAVRLCPTHRNGRLNLASLLCEQAINALRKVLFARREELERIEAQLKRAESLYPQSTELPEAKAMLERVKKSRLSL